MAFTDKQQFKIPRHVVQPGGVNIETITADKTLTYKDSTYQILTTNAGASLVVNLPVVKDGAVFFITCTASSNQTINVKDADGTDIIATPNLGAGKGALVVCDGSEWVVAIEQV
jgi:hypothetical protein